MLISPLAELLEELEACVRATGCPFFDQALPGASLDRIEADLELVGLPLTPDLAAIYGWHNGIDNTAIVWPHLLPNALTLGSLARAIDEYHSATQAEQNFRPSWFSGFTFDHAANISLDTSRIDPESHSSPAATFDFQLGWSDELESAAIAVSWWIEYLKDGTWIWGQDGWIDENSSALHQERRRYGVL